MQHWKPWKRLTVAALAAFFVACPLPAAVEPPDQPAPQRGGDGNAKRTWIEEHCQAVRTGRAAQNPDVVFIGDSITKYLATTGMEELDLRFDARRCLFFAASGDRTQHALWHLAPPVDPLYGALPGILDAVAPRLIVLNIGTNNIAYSASDMKRGVCAVVASIRQRAPDSKLLVMGILPRGADGDLAGVQSQRTKIQSVNQELATLEDNSAIWFLDIGEHFLLLDQPGRTYVNADLLLAPNGGPIFPDGIHPGREGYALYLDFVKAEVDHILGLGE